MEIRNEQIKRRDKRSGMVCSIVCKLFGADHDPLDFFGYEQTKKKKADTAQEIRAKLRAAAGKPAGPVPIKAKNG